MIAKLDQRRATKPNRRPVRSASLAPVAGAGEDHPDRARARRWPDLHRGRPSFLHRKAQVEVTHLAVRPASRAWAPGKGETGIASGQLVTGARAEAVHETEVRPGRRGGLHDHERPGPDRHDHLAKTKLAGPLHRRVWVLPAAVAYVALLAGADEPQRARSQAPGTPISAQRALSRGIAGQQDYGAGGSSWRPGRDRARGRAFWRDSNVTPAAEDCHGCDRSGYAHR
jgi:hypothetical protein